MHLLIFALLFVSADEPALPPGNGREIVQRTCIGCHDLKVVTTKRATLQQWTTLVNQMVSRGADVEDDEVDTLIGYLSKNFPAGDKASAESHDHPAATSVNVNQASAAELASGLDLSDKDAGAIVAYRKENGNFKNLSDLAKVPGLDAKKIDGIKDRVRF